MLVYSPVAWYSWLDASYKFTGCVNHSLQNYVAEWSILEVINILTRQKFDYIS